MEKDVEKIWNVPNMLTLSRVVLTFVVTYLILANFNIILIVLFFTLGMLTDALDGIAARRLNLKTEFGRQFDMVADRIFLLVISLAVLIKFSISGMMTSFTLIQIFLILSRELLAAPTFLVTIIVGAEIPNVRKIGKATTVLQSIAFPLVLLGVFYEAFHFSIIISVATGIVGTIAAFYYINDMKNLIVKKIEKTQK